MSVWCKRYITDFSTLESNPNSSCVLFSAGPIEKESVNALLSKVLCLPPSLSWPLSTVVHKKTGGIILFILMFLASLNDDGDLRFNMSNRRWVFDLCAIELKDIHGDVVSHMTGMFPLPCSSLSPENMLG